MQLINIGEHAAVWISGDESDLYRKLKFRGKLSADELTENQLTAIRNLINKSIVSRKKENGELYYVISNNVID